MSCAARWSTRIRWATAASSARANCNTCPPARGVRHSEFNPSKDEAVHLLQIWIQPDQAGVTPRYAEKKLHNAPTGKLHLMTSKSGRDGSIAIHQDADLWLAKLEAGQNVSHALAKNRHAWVHFAEGEVDLNGKTLAAGDAAAVEGGKPIAIVGEPDVASAVV